MALDSVLISHIIGFNTFWSPLLASKIDRCLFNYNAKNKLKLSPLHRVLKKWIRQRHARNFANEILYRTSPDHITWALDGNARIYTYEEQIDIILSLCGMENECLGPKHRRLGPYQTYPIDVQDQMIESSLMVHALVDYI